ncbi:PDDEXK family nuclease [Lacipirellula limnantheis]|uniref:Endonuclease NucS n=1 Tax=Lacipirellula limnantheis TaxID=2528024 RepID=A0A517TTL6_9BACT|nr:hypothetical protein [Lacipirellula limnantheis]QDT71720.1 hypothetical protein I41_08800 [Lacipirellula limnantheis]
MAIFHITADRLEELPITTFSGAGIRERDDMQRLLRDQIEIIAPETLVISEEFSDWEDSRRRIDLLAIDRDANLVVIELKRTDDGGHMELQAIRYAAMISAMTFDRGVDVYAAYLRQRGDGRDARQSLLDFLGWDEVDDESFARDIRLVLVAADFSKELTTTAIWLGERGIDVRCVRLRPYLDGARLLIDVQQLIPLPEAEEFQVRLREKAQKTRLAKSSQLTEARLFEQLTAQHGDAAGRAARALLDWVEPQVSYIYWGTGDKRAGAVAIRTVNGVRYHVVRIGYQGGIVFLIDRLHRKPPFDQPEMQRELVERMNEIEGVELSPDFLRCRPRIDVGQLTDPQQFSQIKEFLAWVMSHIPTP